MALKTNSAPAHQTKPLTLQPGTIVAKRFKIARRLGQGGLGSVYKATDLTTQKDVAVKVVLYNEKFDFFFQASRALRAEANSLTRQKDYTFQRENRLIACGPISEVAKALMQSIETAKELGTLQKQYEANADNPDIGYIVTELHPGRDLAARLEEEGLLEPTEALDVLAVVFEQLHHASMDGETPHLDLKPANIVDISVIDWGTKNILKRPGAIYGTAAYLSPEQIKHQETTDQTDMYTAGIILFELITGKTPFKEKASIVEVLMATAQGKVNLTINDYVTLPQNKRAILQDLIDHLTQRNPKNRPTSYLEARKLVITTNEKLRQNKRADKVTAKYPPVRREVNQATALTSFIPEAVGGDVFDTIVNQFGPGFATNDTIAANPT